jgi:Glycosyl hydrolase family 76
VAGATALGMLTIGVPTGLAGASPSPAKTAQPAQTAQSTNAARAVATYDALQKYLYIPNYKLYQSADTASLFSYLWDFTNAFAATDYVAGLPKVGSLYDNGLTARDKGIQAYYDADETNPSGTAQPPAYASGVMAPLGDGGSTYYDDNAWVGLDYMQQYQLTGNKQALRDAEGIFHFAVSGWDTTATDTCPGGVYWEDVSGSPRNTVSNGPNAEIGLLVYQITKNPYYLNWAEKMYNWTRGCLLNDNNMYNDHIGPGSTINTALWSYNQGTMIGAGALLYQVTGDSTYLTQANATAAASVAYYSADNNLYGQPDVFNTIFFRNLLYLGEISPNASYRSLLAGYADQAWKEDRQVTGLFTDPDPNGGESLVNQTAPMVEIYALLGGAKPFGITVKSAS